MLLSLNNIKNFITWKEYRPILYR